MSKSIIKFQGFTFANTAKEAYEKASVMWIVQVHSYETANSTSVMNVVIPKYPLSFGSSNNITYYFQNGDAYNTSSMYHLQVNVTSTNITVDLYKNSSSVGNCTFYYLYK